MSSPEIRVTDDHGLGTTVQLPEAMAEQMMVEQRTRALTFEVPNAETQMQMQMHSRPSPIRAASSETSLDAIATLKPAPTSNPLETPVNGKVKGKELNRVASAQGSLRMSLKTMKSATGLLSSKKKHSGEDSRSSGTASPTQTGK